MATVGSAVSVIGGGGGVSADDELQTVRGLGDQGNNEAAVEVSGPHVVDLEHGKRGGNLLVLVILEA